MDATNITKYSGGGPTVETPSIVAAATDSTLSSHPTASTSIGVPPEEVSPSAGAATCNAQFATDGDHNASCSQRSHATHEPTQPPLPNLMDELCRICAKPNATLYDLFEAAQTGDGRDISEPSQHDTSSQQAAAAPHQDSPDEAAAAAAKSSTAASIAKATAQGQRNMESIAQVMQIWQLEIKPNDGLPQRICNRCIAQFYMLHKFRRKCIKVQLGLREMFGAKEKEGEENTPTLNASPQPEREVLNEQQIDELMLSLPPVPKQLSKWETELEEAEADHKDSLTASQVALLNDDKDVKDEPMSVEPAVPEADESIPGNLPLEATTEEKHSSSTLPPGKVAKSPKWSGMGDELAPPALSSCCKTEDRLDSDIKSEEPQQRKQEEQDPLELPKCEAKGGNPETLPGWRARNPVTCSPLPATQPKCYPESSTLVTKAALKEYLIRKSQSRDAELLHATAASNHPPLQTGATCGDYASSSKRRANCSAAAAATTTRRGGLASKRGPLKRGRDHFSNDGYSSSTSSTSYVESTESAAKRVPLQVTDCVVRLKRLRGVEALSPLREYEWKGDVRKPDSSSEECEMMAKFVEKKRKLENAEHSGGGERLEDAEVGVKKEIRSSEEGIENKEENGVMAMEESCVAKEAPDESKEDAPSIGPLNRPEVQLPCEPPRRRVSWKTKAEMKESSLSNLCEMAELSPQFPAAVPLPSVSATATETETDTETESYSNADAASSATDLAPPTCPSPKKAIKIIIKRKRGRPFKRKSKNYIKIAVDERGEDVEYEIKETPKRVEPTKPAAKKSDPTSSIKGDVEATQLAEPLPSPPTPLSNKIAEQPKGQATAETPNAVNTPVDEGFAACMQRKLLMAAATMTTTTTKNVIINNNSKELYLPAALGGGDPLQLPPSALGFTQFIPVQNDPHMFNAEELPKNLIIRIPLNALPEVFQKIHLATNTKISRASFRQASVCGFNVGGMSFAGFGGLGGFGPVGRRTPTVPMGGATAEGGLQNSPNSAAASPATSKIEESPKPQLTETAKESEPLTEPAGGTHSSSGAAAHISSSAAAERSATATAHNESRVASPAAPVSDPVETPKLCSAPAGSSMPDLNSDDFTPTQAVLPNAAAEETRQVQLADEHSNKLPVKESTGSGAATEAPKVLASSKINDFINEFQKHCMDDTEMDSDVAVSPQTAGNHDTATPSTSSNTHLPDAQVADSGHHMPTQPQHLSASHLSEMNDVETALTGILNEMQDQHIYPPVPSHSDDFFDQSVYSPLANEPPPSPRLTETAAATNSATPPHQGETAAFTDSAANQVTNRSLTSTSLAADPFVPTTSQAAGGFPHNFTTYGECFTEENTQSELIGFQNDIPCFENIELASTAGNNLAAQPTSSINQHQHTQQSQPQQQSHHTAQQSHHSSQQIHQSGQQPQLQLTESGVALPMIENALNFFESSVTPVPASQMGAAPGPVANRSTLQFTQLLTEQQQYHLQQQQLQAQMHPPVQQHQVQHQQQQLVQLTDEAAYLNNHSTTTTNLLQVAGSMGPAQQHSTVGGQQVYGKLVHGATLTSENTTKLQFITFAESTPQSIQLLNSVENATHQQNESLVGANGAPGRLNVYTGVNPHEIQWTTQAMEAGELAGGGAMVNVGQSGAAGNENGAGGAATTTTTTTTTYYINAADLYQSNVINTRAATLQGDVRQQFSIAGLAGDVGVASASGGSNGTVEGDKGPSMDANDNYLEGSQNQPIMIVIPQEFMRDGNNQLYTTATNNGDPNNGAGGSGGAAAGNAATMHYTFHSPNQTQPQTVLVQQQQQQQQHQATQQQQTSGNTNQQHGMQQRNMNQNAANYQQANSHAMMQQQYQQPQQRHQQQPLQPPQRRQQSRTKYSVDPHHTLSAAAIAAASMSRHASLASPSTSATATSAATSIASLISPIRNPLLSPQRRGIHNNMPQQRSAPIPLHQHHLSPTHLSSAVHRHLEQYQRELQQDGSQPATELKINLTCRFCHKRPKFTNNLDYSNHIIAVHPAENPYNCPYCPQHFTKRTKRQQHITDEHSTLRFNCAQCGQKFNAQRTLDLHLQRHHALGEGGTATPPPTQVAQQVTATAAPASGNQVQQGFVPNASSWSESNAAKHSEAEVRVEDVHLQMHGEEKDKKAIDLELEPNKGCLELQTATTKGHKEKSQLILRCPDCTDPTDGPCQLHSDGAVDQAPLSDPKEPATAEAATESLTQESEKPRNGEEEDEEEEKVEPLVTSILMPPAPTQNISMPSPEQTEPDSTSTTVLRQYRKRRSSGTKLIHNSLISDTTSSTTPSMSDQLVEVERCSRTSHNCLFCEEQFTNEISLRKHHQLAHGNQTSMPYVCSICKRGFRMRIVLQRHMEAHEKEGRPYECPICLVRFPRPSQLTMHKMSVHFHKKPHACLQCGKQFAAESALKTHMKFHGERTIDCDLCSKKFYLKKDMQKHRRIHTGERFYKCDVCPSSFVHYTRLIAHIKTHIPAGVYEDDDADLQLQQSLNQALAVEQDEDECLSMDTEEVISKLLNDAEGGDDRQTDSEISTNIPSLEPFSEEHSTDASPIVGEPVTATTTNVMPSPISSSLANASETADAMNSI